MYAVEIDQLTYTYPGASQPTLREITLRIPQGDFLAVVGNNGCGKSTLCKTLNGLIPHFITGDFAGRVKVGGLDTLESDVSLLAQKVGYVYQDFENQIVRPTVLDDASYACLNYAFPDYLARGRTALRQCGQQASLLLHTSVPCSSDNSRYSISGTATFVVASTLKHHAAMIWYRVLKTDIPLWSLDSALQSVIRISKNSFSSCSRTWLLDKSRLRMFFRILSCACA